MGFRPGRYVKMVAWALTLAMALYAGETSFHVHGGGGAADAAPGVRAGGIDLRPVSPGNACVACAAAHTPSHEPSAGDRVEAPRPASTAVAVRAAVSADGPDSGVSGSRAPPIAPQLG